MYPHLEDVEFFLFAQNLERISARDNFKLREMFFDEVKMAVVYPVKFNRIIGFNSDE